MLRFAQEARKHRAERLILPIYYVEVPELEADTTPADEAMAAVQPFQREDLRALRLKSQGGAPYRRLVNGLANRLIEIAKEAERAEHGPVESSSAEAPDVPSSGPAEGDPLPGSREGEAMLGSFTPALEALNGDLEHLGRLIGEATAEMDAAVAAREATVASRTAIARRLATRLEDPAEHWEAHVKEYVFLLWELDPLLGRHLDWAEAPAEERGESDAKKELLSSVCGFAASAERLQESFDGLLESLERIASSSRELRQPLRTYQASLRNLRDAQSVIGQWGRRAREIIESGR